MDDNWNMGDESPNEGEQDSVRPDDHAAETAGEQVVKQTDADAVEGESVTDTVSATPSDEGVEVPTDGNAAEQAVEPQALAPKPVAKAAKKEIEAPRELTEEQKNFPWYVVHTYSGYEQRAKLTLEERVKTAGAFEKFGQILVPHEKVVELVRGEKKTTSKKVFPGYILVQCILDDETWHIVKATPKITGFVGDSRNPVPLTKDEVANLVKQMEGEGQRARPSVQFEQGDSVKVVDGPFAEFNGTVDEVKPDKGKLRVLISIFGRNTPVELDFVQVEKV